MLGTRTQLVCVWLTPLCVVILGVGFCAVAGYLPPPRADDTAREITAFYRDNTDAIRLGLLMTFVSLLCWGPLVAVLGQQLLRIEGGKTLARLQMIAGATAWIFLLFPLLILTAAAFRPERSPEVTQTLHDLGWITLFMPITPFVVQAVAIGVATLQDRASAPVFPRWFGYFNLWCALLFVPGGFLTFFKTGPFAYHGLLVYWVPFGVFAIWMLVLAWGARRAVLLGAAGGAAVERHRLGQLGALGEH